MKHLLTAAALMLASAAAADRVLGTWQTQPDDTGNFGHVEIAPRGAAICRTIVRAYAGDGTPRQSDTIGKRMIWDMLARGDGNYRGGKIWAPDRNKTYNSRMMLDGDRLTVRGCVLGIRRGQTWARVNGPNFVAKALLGKFGSEGVP